MHFIAFCRSNLKCWGNRIAGGRMAEAVVDWPRAAADEISAPVPAVIICAA